MGRRMFLQKQLLPISIDGVNEPRAKIDAVRICDTPLLVELLDGERTL